MSICRGCLRAGPHRASVAKGRSARMFKTLGPKSDDPRLPTSLCVDCDKRLPAAAAFVALCRRSERQLLRALRRGLPLDTLCGPATPKPSPPPPVIPLRETSPHPDSSSERESSAPTPSVRSPSKEENPNWETVTLSERGTTKTMIKCTLCGVLVRCKSAFAVHYRKHNGERPHECPHCRKNFSQGGTLSEHIRRKHDAGYESSGKSFDCEFCGKRFTRKGDLLVHLRIHTKERPYRCPSCPSRFAQRITLAHHRMIHTGERPFACEVCDKKFIARSTLRRHSFVHSDERNFKCDTCDKAFKFKVSLNRHMLSLHSSQKPNVCEKCGVTFANESNLKAHMKSVHSELSGDCAICKKHFSNLNDHARIHTGEKPFQCHLCDRRFPMKRSLTAHINRHQNAAKYACDFEGCNKTFSVQSALDFHTLKFHSNHTPHVCQYCSKGFYRLSDLSKHVKNAHYVKHDATNSSSNTKTLTQL